MGRGRCSPSPASFRRFANPSLRLVSERGTRHKRTPPCVQSRLALRSFVPRPTFVCASSHVRLCLVPRSLTRIRGVARHIGQRGWMGRGEEKKSRRSKWGLNVCSFMLSRCSKLFYTISRCHFHIESTFSRRICSLRPRSHSPLCFLTRRKHLRPDNALSM